MINILKYIIFIFIGILLYQLFNLKEGLINKMHYFNGSCLGPGDVYFKYEDLSDTCKKTSPGSTQLYPVRFNTNKFRTINFESEKKKNFR